MTRKPSDADHSSDTTDTQKATGDSGYATSNCTGKCRGSKTGSGGSGTGSGRSQSHSGSSRSSGFGDQNINDAFQPPINCFRKDGKKKKTCTPPQSLQNDTVEEAAKVTAEPMLPNFEIDWNKTSGNLNKEPDPGGSISQETTRTQDDAMEIASRIHSDEEETEQIIGQGSEGEWKDVDALFTDSMPIGTFAVEVGMRDGIVTRHTHSLAQVVGYPDRFWTGRPFIRMIRESDRVSFGKYVTSVMTDPCQPVMCAQNPKIRMSSSKLFCCLREYRGLTRNGFSVKDKETRYIPCQLGALYCEDRGTILIVAKTLKKAYNEGDEKFGMPHFYTTQSADCRLMAMDAQAVRYLGYLPHNVLDQSVLNFYHPEDWTVVKEMYDSVFAETNRKDRCKDKQNASTEWSKTYRFRAQNGDWVLLSTQFSIVFNVWTQQLHALIGKHRVVQGPHNPDVFARPAVNDVNYPDEILKDWKSVEDMIKVLMKRAYRSPSDKQHASHKSKHLASFVRNFVEFVTKADQNEDGSSTGVSPKDPTVRQSQSQVNGSRSSSETQPSYGQLNFRENIARFLLSGIDDAEPVPDLLSKVSEKRDGRSGLDSGSGSGGGCSGAPGGEGSGNGSGGNESAENSSSNNVKPAVNVDCAYTTFLEGSKPLTREILYRHNETMAQKMILRHKERAKDSRIKNVTDTADEQVHGQKRCGSDSWEGNKDKYLHTSSIGKDQISGGDKSATAVRDASIPLAVANVGMWRPVAVSSVGPTILPLVYYMPTEGTLAPVTLPGPSQMPNVAELQVPTSTIKPVPLLNHFAMFTAPTLVYPAVSNQPPSTCTPLPISLEDFRRPQSQATSVKPEQGSTHGSAIMSEGSKNNENDAEYLSPMTDEEKSKDLEMSSPRYGTGTGDDSSFSLSSFNKTDSGGSYIPEPAPARPMKEDPPWLKNMNMTDDMIYRYQITSKDMATQLAEDEKFLKHLPQPDSVENQLQQLYVDLEKAGLSTRLKLDYDNTSSGTSSGEDNKKTKDMPRKRKCRCDYTKLTMIHEELILPPPSPTPSQI